MPVGPGMAQRENVVVEIVATILRGHHGCGNAGQRRKAMWDVYGPAMQAVVGARLNAGEIVKLAKLLDKLIPDES